MRAILLDTNFLLMPHQFGINVDIQLERLLQEPHYFAICEPVMEEVRKIALGHGKKGVAARVGIKWAEKANMKVIAKAETGSESDFADDWIVAFCEKNPGTIVCTNDYELRKRVKKTAGCRVIAMRTRAGIGWA
jgi:uncharacterized protein